MSLPPASLYALAGHYGSGKTLLAVNLALYLRQAGPVTLADLDIVNPYFRSQNSQDVLKAAGIGLIASAYAGSNVDLPAISAEVSTVFSDRNTTFVVDVGGDERGARALGRFAPQMPNDAEVLLVFNHYRPQTKDFSDTLKIIREIEDASRLRFTGLVNNSNLGAETTTEVVLAALPFSEELSQKIGLPIVLNAVPEKLLSRLDGQMENIFPLTHYGKPQWAL